jgi:hypothetical protein
MTHEARRYMRMYEAQFQWILRRCGKLAATQANYGWSSSTDEDKSVSACTKVYGHGILWSEVVPGVRRVEHQWSAFPKEALA